jgi:hypothetical protein
MSILTRLTTSIFCLFLASPIPASADVVTDWNSIAAPIIFGGVPPRTGGAATLDFATVHAAVHDAIQAFEKRFESYAEPIANASGSPVAAAAKAAHDVLAARFPANAAALNTTLTDYLNSKGLSLADPGVLIGQEAAARVINLRMGDGSFPASSEVFTGGTRPGEWRPAPGQSMAVPWLGQVTPFTLKYSSQLSASPPPPHLGSGVYTKDYNEVKALGSLNSTARTPAQTALATFYTLNTIDLWQRTLRSIVGTGADTGFNARLFALANMAAADAIIASWYDKRFWNFWRPSTAIHEGDNDGNPRTAGDATWQPFLPTPSYPDYTSGANALTGAMTRTLARLFGDKVTFLAINPLNQTKTYHRFSDLAQDMVDVRVYQGIHFRSADEVACRQGTRAADWAVSHFLRPLR